MKRQADTSQVLLSFSTTQDILYFWRLGTYHTRALLSPSVRQYTPINTSVLPFLVYCLISFKGPTELDPSGNGSTSRSNVLLDHVSTTNKLSQHVYCMSHVSDQTIILILIRRKKHYGGGGGTINTSTERQTCTTTSTTLLLYLRPELRHRTIVTGCTG